MSTTSARDYDVSGMAPLSRIMRRTVGADLQENLSAMAHDLARGLKQPPAHGLHLRTLPSASKRIGARKRLTTLSLCDGTCEVSSRSLRAGRACWEARSLTSRIVSLNRPR